MSKKVITELVEIIKNENDGKHNDYILPGYQAKKLIGYHSMRQDLILCKDALETLLLEKNNIVVSSCLYYTFLALYGKCFTDASTFKFPKLEENDFREEGEGFIKHHREIMTLRHQFIAHRGETNHETSIAYLRINTDTLNKHVRVKMRKTNKPNKTTIKRYIEIIDFLITVAENKFQYLGLKVWKHMLKEYTPDQFAALKIAGQTTI